MNIPTEVNTRGAVPTLQPREAKYKAKTAIDTFFFRAGETVSLSCAERGFNMPVKE